MSTPAADQILAETAEAAAARFGPRLEAVYALGSLAHGGFAPLVSDIDVAIVLSATDAGTATEIAALEAAVRARDPHPLTQRLSVFWGDWTAVRTGRGEHLRLGPIDRLDLLDAGRLLIGEDRREPAIRPSAEELVAMSADFIARKFTAEYLAGLADTAELLAGGPRAVTKAVLFPVRFLYTLHSGRIGLNVDAARWYVARELPGAPLAAAAIAWRETGLPDPEHAAELLDAHLEALHEACLDAYAEHFDPTAGHSLSVADAR